MADATAPEGVESRREWRVWATWLGAARPTLWAVKATAAEADESAAWAADRSYELVEIEEREITTRVVSRRVVPRATEEGEGMSRHVSNEMGDCVPWCAPCAASCRKCGQAKHEGQCATAPADAGEVVRHPHDVAASLVPEMPHIVEPADSECAAWLDATREYVESLEVSFDLLTSALAARAREAEESRARVLAWTETAAQHARNEDYYRGLVDRIASECGPEAYTDDTGQRHDSPMRDKVPEVVRDLLRRLTTEAAELRARCERLAAAVQYAEQVFLSYVEMHEAKGTVSGYDKAATNLKHIARMRRPFTTARAAETGGGE